MALADQQRDLVQALIGTLHLGERLVDASDGGVEVAFDRVGGRCLDFLAGQDDEIVDVAVEPIIDESVFLGLGEASSHR